MGHAKGPSEYAYLQKPKAGTDGRHRDPGPVNLEYGKVAKLPGLADAMVVPQAMEADWRIQRSRSLVRHDAWS